MRPDPRRPQVSRLLGRAALVAASVGSVAGCVPPCPDSVPPFSDDPESTEQWHLPALGVPDAWERERGDGSVVVAVIDNGFDGAHPDLAGQLWSNPLESPNGLDDDGNGFVDDVVGWDFLDNDADPTLDDEVSSSEHASHGTAAAGIVAAATDNGVGVAGCCPRCRLMLLRGRDFGAARTVMPVLAEAIRYAVDNGARVVSVSDGVPVGSVEPHVAAAVQAALEEARDAGTVVVVSAGNDGAAGVRWPAVLSAVVAVGAVDPEGGPTSWTSVGPEVDVAAPGECILTTAAEGGYERFAGTSASAPIVAGLAALLLSAHPEWSAEQVVARIERTARPLDWGDAEGLGRGIVDFEAALAE